MRERPNNATPTEQKFWTSIKTFFTTLEANDEIGQQNMIWIYLLGLVSVIAFITCVYGLIGSLFS